MCFTRRTLMALGLVLCASGALAEDAPLQITGAKTVNADEVISIVSAGPALVILDNRKPEDYTASAIEGAVRLLDTDINADSLAKQVPSKSAAVLFYCNGLKCGRAAKAAKAAVELGY